MKAKDLIRMLQGLEPECIVVLSLGSDNKYRTDCAKAELVVGECLGYLAVDRIELYLEDEDTEPDMFARIILRQNNLGYLLDEAKEFDKTYKKIEDNDKNK